MLEFILHIGSFFLFSAAFTGGIVAYYMRDQIRAELTKSPSDLNNLHFQSKHEASLERLEVLLENFNMVHDAIKLQNLESYSSQTKVTFAHPSERVELNDIPLSEENSRLEDLFGMSHKLNKSPIQIRENRYDLILATA